MRMATPMLVKELTIMPIWEPVAFEEGRMNQFLLFEFALQLNLDLTIHCTVLQKYWNRELNSFIFEVA